MSEAIEDMVYFIGTGDAEQIEKVGGKVVEDRVYFPLNYLQEFAHDPNTLILVSEVIRPGVQLFATKLEHTYFPPDTELNRNFQLGCYNWKECFDMPFVIIMIPADMRDKAEKLAEECDIRFADGVPTMLHLQSALAFPVNGPSVYRLENLPGSKVYAGALNSGGDLAAYREYMQGLHDEEKQKTKTFLVEAGVKLDGEDDTDKACDGDRPRT